MQKKNKAKRGHWIWVCLIPAALLVWWPLWFLCTGALMPEEELELNGYHIKAFRVNHNVTCYGYSIEIKRAGKFNLEQAQSLNIR